MADIAFADPTLAHLQPNVWLRRAAALGFLGWLASLLLVTPDWAVTLFLLAPLVLVPLGLGLLSSSIPARFRRALAWAQPLAALLLIVSFAWPDPSRFSLSAQMSALPWLGVTLVLALFGLTRMVRRGFGPLEELCIDAGLIYLAVGGGWTAIWRFGFRPMGFEPLIVLLTAVHFHYAGFVLPLLTGMLGRASGGSRLYRIAAIGVIAGVPLVAVGIAFWPLLETVAALFLAAACLLVAGLQVHCAVLNSAGLRRPLRGLLLIVSAVSLIVGMILAALYGLRQYDVLPYLDIPLMLPFHGAVNAFGFALAGLLAWTLAPPLDKARCQE